MKLALLFLVCSVPDTSHVAGASRFGDSLHDDTSKTVISSKSLASIDEGLILVESATERNPALLSAMASNEGTPRGQHPVVATTGNAQVAGTLRRRATEGGASKGGASKGGKGASKGGKGASKGGKGKGASKGGDYNIQDAFETCSKACSATGAKGYNEPSENAVVITKLEKFKKPSCCKGGLSALKAKYLGKDEINLYLAGSDSVSAMTIADTCGGSSNIIYGDDDVKFADCEKCFLGHDGMVCNPVTDVWDSVTLSKGDEVCLTSYGEKLPTDLTLFYQAPEDAAALAPLTLHTSCSKPIYAPYAMKFGACPGESDQFINLAKLSVSEFHDLLEEAAFFKFVDGVSVKSPGALLSDCEIPIGHKASQCCNGGASFLRTEFGGTDLSGFLTFDKEVAAMYSSCVSDSEPLASQSDMPLRFASCADVCHTDPFTSEPCSSAFDMVSVAPGDAVCFGRWDNTKGRIAYGEKMPADVDIFFIPNNHTVSVYTGTIHTSCSTPVYPPYAQALDDACSSSQQLLNLQETGIGEATIHLAFRDGLSSHYYSAASEFSGATSLDFDISFAGCGCSCAPSLAPLNDPTASPMPSALPSGAPSSAPSSDPLVRPSVTPSSNPSSQPTVCVNECSAWVLESCVFRNTTEPCDVGQQRRLLHDNQGGFPANEIDPALLSPSEQIAFHKEMVTLFSELLSLLE